MAPLTKVSQFWPDNRAILQVALYLCDISYGSEALLGLFLIICVGLTRSRRGIEILRYRL